MDGAGYPVTNGQRQELLRRNRERISLLKPAADAHAESLRPLCRAARVRESNRVFNFEVDVGINK